METLGVLEEIESLVSDKLQVVSYKWLSRNFLISSDAAKRLLLEFVETRGNGFQVVYTLSGWLKNNPPSYHIKLVSGSNLEEAKKGFDGNCSVHVYSVQVCIPRDPAELWNTEFVQAEELSKQPSTVDNCLRDNRFCGISNSFIKRNIDGAPISNAPLQPKLEGTSGPSRTNSAGENLTTPHPQLVKAPQLNTMVDPKKPYVITDVKTEIHGTAVPADKGKVPLLPAKKKTGENLKVPSGNGGSIANLWGRASTKSKSTSGLVNDSNLQPNITASAEAQTCALEAMVDVVSDEEAQDVKFRRASNGVGNRKRRVIFDYSDDEFEDVIDIASPDLLKGQSSSSLDAEKHIQKEQSETKPKIEEKLSDRSSNRQFSTNTSTSNIVHSKGSLEIVHAAGAGDDSKENIVTNGTSNSPKRRKVLKTHIDERGREVTQVVWEGVNEETKMFDGNVAKKAEKNVVNKSESAPKKPPTMGTAPNPGGKAASKKGGNKDSKQGNILSFFKRV